MSLHAQLHNHTLHEKQNKGDSYIKRPTGTKKNGIINGIRRDSGSNMPLFLLAIRSAIKSVNPPPTYDPIRIPMMAGML